MTRDQLVATFSRVASVNAGLEFLAEEIPLLRSFIGELARQQKEASDSLLAAMKEAASQPR